MVGVKRVRECVLHQDTINSVKRRGRKRLESSPKNSAQNLVERKKREENRREGRKKERKEKETEIEENR